MGKEKEDVFYKEQIEMVFEKLEEGSQGRGTVLYPVEISALLSYVYGLENQEEALIDRLRQTLNFFLGLSKIMGITPPAWTATAKELTRGQVRRG